ncbi:MAG: VOC family protein [Clostridia bacterium]|nr:VOC family protein [Clostridia bacterium]
MVTSFAHAALTVRDMDKSVDFYTRVLGFEKAFDIPEPGTGKPWIVYLAVAPGQFLELFYGGTTPVREFSKEITGFNHLCFGVSDIRAAAERVEKAGVALDRPVSFGADGNGQCWVRDPDRNRIELMQIMPNSPQATYFAEK